MSVCLSSKLHPWLQRSPSVSASPLNVPRPPAAPSSMCDGKAVSSKVAKGDSQNTAFPSIHVQLVWLSGDLSAATIGLGVKLLATMAPFSERTIRTGKTIRYDTNERDKYTKPRTPTCIIYTHTRLITGILSAIFFLSPSCQDSTFPALWQISKCSSIFFFLFFFSITLMHSQIIVSHKRYYLHLALKTC